MPVAIPSLSTVIQSTVGYFRNRLPDWALGPRDLFGKVSRAVSLSVYSFLKTARQIDLDAVPSDSTSTEGLDAWAEGLGLDNGNGGYGRHGAEAATGGAGTFTGVGGTVFADGTMLTAEDGITRFELDGAVTIPGVAPDTGSASGTIIAITTGSAGNLDVGAVLTVDSPPAGGDARVTLTTGLSGGAERESNSALLGRVLRRLRFPPKAVTANDLRTEAEDVTGIDRAYVYKRRSGTGTADVVPTVSGSGASRRPSIDQVADVQAALDLIATVSIDDDKLKARRLSVAGSGLAVVARVAPSSSRFAFDYDSSVSSRTVSAYNAGTPSITASGAMPADFIAAVGAGLRPRIQVITTGVVLPQLVAVTAYNAMSHVLTLASPLGTAPTVGDAIHAGSDLVTPVAEAILDYANTLGPSRASGFADPNDVWEDTLYIDQLRRVALSAADDDGVRYVTSFVAAPTIDGSATDAQADDDGVNPPELLYLASVAVTP